MRKIAILTAILFVTGCTYLGLAPPPSVCDDAPENSVICRVCTDLGTTPEAADLILQAATLRALDSEQTETVLQFYRSVEDILELPISYTALINYVQDYVRLTGPEIMFISMYLPRFESPKIITTFDKGLLLTHVKRMVVALGGLSETK